MILADLLFRVTALAEEQAANRAEIIQVAAALMHESGQLIQLKQRQVQSPCLAFVMSLVGGRQMVLDVAKGLVDGVLQHHNELMCALDGLERAADIRIHEVHDFAILTVL